MNGAPRTPLLGRYDQVGHLQYNGRSTTLFRPAGRALASQLATPQDAQGAGYCFTTAAVTVTARSVRVWPLSHKVLALVAELREKGVHLVIGRAMTIDTRIGGPTTDMGLLMLGTFAEMELVFQRERRASARASREANGKTWGRPREIDRSAVLADLEDGMSVMKVAAKHGIGRATVFRIKAEAKES
ncbi:helix-turn-helix domain-containing protein [Streptomyces dysideae]|uniref:Resolvase/invertase-type recombinase catalytic domain-containing protein n=1 Tax=Streptomyces dysideae TaxID=909626 RepID=A0A117S1I1_9ACTN|nr:helix-turn-helix domain-containing protein [Streptomyces dysideae]KUO20346.1 hypothetical protein AQJ91_14465 [Streptomyces dysideae]